MSKLSLIWTLCLVWTLWLGLLAAAEPRDVVAAEPPDRPTLEAIALFRSVVKHKPGELGSCALTDRWNHYAVPKELARRHLGMKLHAELVSPSAATTPARHQSKKSQEQTLSLHPLMI